MKNDANSAVKFYARRDSATAELRKLGVRASDYNSFIEVMSNGQFACQVARAEMYLNSLKSQKTAEKTATTKLTDKQQSFLRSSEENGVLSSNTETCSSVARAMIIGGSTNTEVWEVIKVRFNLDDSKRHYPSWYRSDLKRRGQIS